jgi:hypothetical protein
MTISTTASRISYNGNGVTLAFSFPVRFLVNGDVVVVLRSSAGVESTLLLGTHYSLTGAGDDAGGTVTMFTAPAVGERLVIQRIVALTQETDYISGDPFPAETHERALDRLTMAAQQLQDSVDRTLRFPVSDTVSSALPTQAVRADRLLGFDSMGNPIAVAPVDGTAIALATDLAASGGADMVGFLQAGTGAVARTAQSKMRDVVSVKDFGAVGDGVADDTVAIQAAITASKGRRLLFPPGRYYTTSTITVPHPMILVGEGSALNDSDGTGASTILFAGTGPALQFGGAGYQIFYPNLQNIRIQATGAAITDASAIGLQLVNIQGGKFYDLAVRSFQAGTGVLCTATAGQISSGNTFWGPHLWQNFTGFKFDGAGAANPFAADYASYIFGGVVIGIDDDGVGIAGSRGLWVTQYAAETQVYATDFETFEFCIDLYGDGTTTGGGVKLMGTRTEFQRTRAIRINATTNKTQIIGHRFAGGAASSWLQDNGTRTLRLDPDGSVRLNTSDIEVLNEIPFRAQDSTGVTRQLLKMASNDTTQIGSTNYAGFNGNFALGTWNFTSPNITTPTFTSAGGASGWQNPVLFGIYRLWVDSTGKLRIRSGAPANDTDGTVVGTQT